MELSRSSGEKDTVSDGSPRRVETTGRFYGDGSQRGVLDRRRGKRSVSEIM